MEVLTEFVHLYYIHGIYGHRANVLTSASTIGWMSKMRKNLTQQYQDSHSILPKDVCNLFFCWCSWLHARNWEHKRALSPSIWIAPHLWITLTAAPGLIRIRLVSSTKNQRRLFCIGHRSHEVEKKPTCMFWILAAPFQCDSFVSRFLATGSAWIQKIIIHNLHLSVSHLCYLSKKAKPCYVANHK